MRDKSMRFLYVLMMTFAVSFGCAQQMTQSEIRSLESRELDLTYDKAYSATINGLFALGFTVDHSDKASGVVTGKRHDSQNAKRLVNTVLFGVVGAVATKERDEAVTFMVSPNGSAKTLLRMKVVVDGKAIVDRTLMTRIWQQIEKEGMLDDAFKDAGSGATTQPASTSTQKNK